MVSDLHVLAERLRQRRATFARALTPAPASASSAEGRIGLTFTPGARVFDRVTGLEGIVLAGARENFIVPAPERPER